MAFLLMYVILQFLHPGIIAFMSRSMRKLPDCTLNMHHWEVMWHKFAIGTSNPNEPGSSTVPPFHSSSSLQRVAFIVVFVLEFRLTYFEMDKMKGKMQW